MSDSLHPLRLAYGLADRPPGSGPAAEEELLRQMRRLLEAAPRERPYPDTVQAVEASAARAGRHGEHRAALGGTAESAAAQAGGAESEILRQSLAALDTLPAAAPEASTLDAVLAAANAASGELAPVRAAYGLGAADGADARELALLSGTRRVLDAARREHRPDAAATDAVLARAADWTARTDTVPVAAPDLAAVYDGAPADTVPAALMAGAADALDRLPAARPSGDAVAAVLAAAATATREARATSAAPPPVARRAAPGTAAPGTAAPAALWARRPAVWASGAAMLAAVAIVVTLFGTEPTPAPEAAPSVQAESVPPPAAPDEAPPPDLADASAAPAPAPAPAPISAGAQALAAGGPLAGVPSTAGTAAPLASRAVLGAPPVRSAQPVRRAAPTLVAAEAAAAPVVAPSAPAPAPRRDVAPTDPVGASAGVAAAALADDAAKTGPEAWDAGDDVRLLSLRLQELRRQNQGLDWDDAEAFGAPTPAAFSATPGVQAVGSGRLSGVPAARARATVDSTLDR